MHNRKTILAVKTLITNSVKLFINFDAQVSDEHINGGSSSIVSIFVATKFVH